MDSFFSLVRRHGFKMGLATFLGYAVSYTAFYIGLMIFVLMALMIVGGMIGGMVGGADSIEDFIEESLSPEAIVGLGLLGILVMILIYLGILFVSFMVQSFLSGGIFGMGKEVLLENRSRVGTFFSEGFRYLWRLTGQTFLLGLLVIPVYLLVMVPTIMVTDMLGTVGSFVAIPIFLAFICFLMIFYIHAPALLVREDLRVVESIKYTFKTVFSSFFSVFISTLLFFVSLIMINFLYFLISGLTVGFFILLQTLAHESFVVLTLLTGIPLGLLYFVIVLPMSVAVAHLVTLYRYEKHIRPMDTELVQVA